MKIADILTGLEYILLEGNVDKDIRQIQYDSRRVEKGDLFVCITGLQADGHAFASKALEQGAAALLVEKEIGAVPEGVAVIKVPNTRKALALCAANYYGRPSEKMNLIGVTGTNGKTTTTYLIKSILDKAGHKVGIVGTIENRIGDKKIHTERTTPESLDLQELFSEMVSERVNDVVMEVSSHSLALDRVAGCRFQIGIFTNLTQDHLDYHKTMENYKKAKGILFEMCREAVINIDDAAGEYMEEAAKGKRMLTTGIDNEKADLLAENIHISANGVRFTLDYAERQYPVVLNIPGKFSIYNALGAIGACLLMGIDMETILAGLADNKGVPGRFQTVESKRGFNAIVDYAHTPDGLENILNTAHEFVRGRILTVFGCGGDRDRTKRPVMGEIAGRLSDFCIITSDNPRTEDPYLILDDVEPGTQKTGCPYIKIVDRREAIFHAVKMAEKDDLVVIAGKGHENYQIFADKTIHFDDVEVVREAFGEDAK